MAKKERNAVRLEQKLNQKLQDKFGGAVHAAVEDGVIRVSGSLDRWEDVIEACSLCVTKKAGLHVVNDIRFAGGERQKMRAPKERDDSLDGQRPDVLIIGGGISGCSIARELTRWKLDVLLVEKEADLAAQASGRNDGEVHPGVDLGKGSLKQKYVVRGNRMYDTVCRELDVPFRRCGQYVGFTDWIALPAILLYVWNRKHVCGVDDTKVVFGKTLHQREPELNPDFKFAIYNPMAGSVCPYGLTIAYGENAVTNGAQISLNTAVEGMTVRDGHIVSVSTNRGRVYPRLIVNAAGVFAEDVAAMAGDRFYSIHPRRGTNSILDKKAGRFVQSIASVKLLKKSVGHTKGGGIIHTVDHNLLVGPDAVETWEKENFATEAASIERVFSKQKQTSAALSEGDIITYFTGVRAAVFEEDFIIEPGRKTDNLIHCAGIQSPGLTTAPAVAEDVAKMAVKWLSADTPEKPVEKNPDFDPHRKGVVRANELSAAQRDALIRSDPDYGVIVCRCEEISKGEILDALRSPVPVATVDGIKKRVRAGMGRCQGGFCLPLVMRIIAEHEGIPPEQVKKAGAEAFLTFGPTKGGAEDGTV